MIEAEDLTKFYGPIAAIRNVTFQVEKGEIVGFLGPNGAGKSTTIRILTCYMPPTSGTARVGGLDCMERSLEIRRMVGYLPENVPLYRDLTVRRFLRFAASAKGVAGREVEKEVRRAIGVCGLEKNANRIISHLSKGFRQRVGLAQALLNDPPVLVLDEPTIGLDPSQIIEIRHLVQELGENRTILLSSHILPEVAQICRRVLIINKGEIIATDSPENLTSQLQKTAKIMLEVSGPVPGLAPALEKIGGVQSVETHGEGAGKFVIETDTSVDVRPEIARLVVGMGSGLLELRSVHLSLEDIFMQLVTEEAEGTEETPETVAPEEASAREGAQS
ncbi:MAG: ATP-binding cassette domain-containing protein [Syntrophobacteraceae bacterium]